MKRSILLAAVVVCVFSAHASESYTDFFKNKAGLVTSSGTFITLHKAEGRVWFEIPTRYMGRRMLMASTLTAISDGRFGNAGYKQQKPLHIRFALTDSMLHIRTINSDITTDYISDALVKVNGDPIIASFPVVARGSGDGSVVVEMSDFLLDNPAYFNFFTNGTESSNPTIKRESCWFGDIKAFADNVSVKSTLTFAVPGSSDEGDQPVTAEVTRSILLLPEVKMTPRLSDSRVGVFTTDKIRYSSLDEGSQTYSLANRWRVVPSDVEAYARGESVEPTRKIVWYIEPDFPEFWMETLKRAVENWNEAFEAIGFRNVLEARPFPTPAQDPEFDPDNLKYSCIRLLPSPLPNAMGPSWVDPATGEIINASVIVWSDVVKLVNKWRFVQTAQIDPRVRRMKMPDEVMLESLEYVLSHEVGHTLGFAHSMASSHAWPVDSLRSATFTRLNGTTPSIMDYARFNYIAQPGDAGVTLTPPKIGVYDKFLVEWTYRYVPGTRDEWDEAATVESWVDAVAGNPIYRYGRQQLAAQYDPSALDEDLGDDPIRAGDYGIANLRYILPRMQGWIPGDNDYEHRRELYLELCEQYCRYVRNVTMNIGGIYLTEVKDGTPGRRIVPVPGDIQKASLRWVMEQYRNMEWLDEPSLRQHFPLGTYGAAELRERIAGSLGKQMACVVLSSYYANMAAGSNPHTTNDKAYTVQEFTDDLFDETWRHARLHPRRALDHGERTLQRTMVDMFCAPVVAIGGGGSAEAIASGRGSRVSDIGFGPAGMGYQDPVDISAIDDSADHLTELAIRSRNLIERTVRHSRGATRAHYRSLLMKLNAALKDKL